MRIVFVLALAAGLHAEERFLSREWKSAGLKIERMPMEFRAAGFYCGEPARARASADGGAWSEWVEVESSEEGTLVFFADPRRYLQVTAACRVLLIDPGETPKDKQRAAVESPGFVKREDWGCTLQSCPSASPPSYTTVTHLVVHHSAGSNSSNDWPAVVRAIWVLHVQGNGWNDIGYNYLIDPRGVLYEGRAGGDGVLGAHFSGVNGGTMGVCMLGTYSGLAPTGASLDTLRRMLAFHAAKWNIDPGGRSLHASSGLMLNHISGHRDAALSPRASGATECPGNGMYALLAEIRKQVREFVEAPCPLTIERPQRCVSGAESAIEVPVSLPEGCELKVASRSSWIDVSSNGNGVRLSIAANPSPSIRLGSVAVNGQLLHVAQAGSGSGAPPCIDFDGVVNPGGFDGRPLVAGSLMTLFGTDLAPSEAKAETAEWPLELAQTRVEVNGRRAPLAYVSPNQINAQVPAGTPIGSARLVVMTNGVAGPERLFWVSEAVPAILFAGGEARRGEVVNIYLTGAGRIGQPWSSTFGEPVSLENAVGLPGVQLARVRVPAEAAPGEYEISIRIAGVTSQSVRLRISD
jgi:hypothetical protein